MQMLTYATLNVNRPVSAAVQQQPSSGHYT
jgi:hypothetical protein